MTRFVTQRSLTRPYPARYQPLARISRLVTYPGVWVPVSNTRDARPATAASDPHSPTPVSAPGSPAWQTTAANSCACAPSDSQTRRNISGRADGASPTGINRRSADTYAFAFRVHPCPPFLDVFVSCVIGPSRTVDACRSASALGSPPSYSMIAARSLNALTISGRYSRRVARKYGVNATAGPRYFIRPVLASRNNRISQ